MDYKITSFVLVAGLVLGFLGGTIASSSRIGQLEKKLNDISGQTAASDNLKNQVAELKIQLEKLNVNELYGLVKIGNSAKAYKIGDLNKMPPAIANDNIGQTPVVVSWCPLCSTLTVYERSLPDDIVVGGKTIPKGTVLTFRDAGARKIPGTDIENLHLKDEQTGSIWAQGPGMAVEGPAKGQELHAYSVQLFNGDRISKMGAPVWNP